MSSNTGKPHPKSKFSAEEDWRLSSAVYRLGVSDWNEIAKAVPGRNARQCRERWVKYLCPSNRSEPFTRQEDELLRRLYEQHGGKWVILSKYFQRRTDIQIKNRWLVLTRQQNKREEFLRRIDKRQYVAMPPAAPREQTPDPETIDEETQDPIPEMPPEVVSDHEMSDYQYDGDIGSPESEFDVWSPFEVPAKINSEELVWK